MATVDKRGARADLRVFPSSGLVQEFQVTTNSVAVDITNYTFPVTVSNDDDTTGYNRTSPVTTKTYTGVITDAANGKFTVTMPASDFASLWGEQALYGVQSQVSGGTALPFVWGKLNFEALT